MGGKRTQTRQSGPWCHHRRAKTSDLDKPAADCGSPAMAPGGRPSNRGSNDDARGQCGVEDEGREGSASVCTVCVCVCLPPSSFPLSTKNPKKKKKKNSRLRIEIIPKRRNTRSNVGGSRQADNARTRRTGLLIPSQATGFADGGVGWGLLFPVFFHGASSLILPFAQPNLVSYTDTHPTHALQ